MDNNLNTGKPAIDMIALGLAWVFAFINWATVPIILSCTASMFVIVKQALDMWDRRSKNKKPRR